MVYCIQGLVPTMSTGVGMQNPIINVDEYLFYAYK